MQPSKGCASPKQHTSPHHDPGQPARQVHPINGHKHIQGNNQVTQQHNTGSKLARRKRCRVKPAASVACQPRGPEQGQTLLYLHLISQATTQQMPLSPCCIVCVPDAGGRQDWCPAIPAGTGSPDKREAGGCARESDTCQQQPRHTSPDNTVAGVGLGTFPGDCLPERQRLIKGQILLYKTRDRSLRPVGHRGLHG